MENQSMIGKHFSQRYNKKIIKNQEEHTKEVQSKAALCLNSALFADYRDLCEESEKIILGTLKKLKWTTAEQYGMIVFDLIGQLKNNEMLLNLVIDNAALKVTEEEKRA